MKIMHTIKRDIQYFVYSCSEHINIFHTPAIMHPGEADANLFKSSDKKYTSHTLFAFFHTRRRMSYKCDALCALNDLLVSDHFSPLIFQN
jgi:hypothetical protein